MGEALITRRGGGGVGKFNVVTLNGNSITSYDFSSAAYPFHLIHPSNVSRRFVATGVDFSKTIIISLGYAEDSSGIFASVIIQNGVIVKQYDENNNVTFTVNTSDKTISIEGNVFVANFSIGMAITIL